MGLSENSILALSETFIKRAQSRDTHNSDIAKIVEPITRLAKIPHKSHLEILI